MKNVEQQDPCKGDSNRFPQTQHTRLMSEKKSVSSPGRYEKARRRRRLSSKIHAMIREEASHTHTHSMQIDE